MHLFAFLESCGSEERIVIVFSSVRLGYGIESCKSTISIQQNCLFVQNQFLEMSEVALKYCLFVLSNRQTKHRPDLRYVYYLQFFNVIFLRNRYGCIKKQNQPIQIVNAERKRTTIC